MTMHFEFEEAVGIEWARLARRVAGEVFGRLDGDWSVRFFRIDKEALGVRVGHQGGKHVCRFDAGSVQESRVRGALVIAVAKLAPQE